MAKNERKESLLSTLWRRTFGAWWCVIASVLFAAVVPARAGLEIAIVPTEGQEFACGGDVAGPPGGETTVSFSVVVTNDGSDPHGFNGRSSSNAGTVRSGEIDVTAAVYGLNFCFLGGPPPVAPYPECETLGPPAEGALGCETAPEACS